ncbi:MATE family efflux transporter [Burkholderia vietnamiensis]|uniref:MATE family efflux transporter n=1 Tax=Burkholderia vietnamiensis TaxID=60552 RepID=UPI000D785960|nr:MATE family efflux transporter [Burkholderia vietnamiensis]GBH28069.1 MATE family efflux transporter [Burkholderia vietnamiensis]
MSESALPHAADTASAAVSHRRVLALAFPIVLANLTQPLLGAVDTAVAGHLDGAQYLGGVALGGLVFNFVFWGFGFLRMGTTGLVAQAHGARDAAGIRLSVLRAPIVAFVLGAAVPALQVPLLSFALTALGGRDAVHATALASSCARIWSAPFALANYVVLGYLLGVQRVRLALVAQVFINAGNIGAGLLYVYGFGWGIAGIGAATATADACGCALGAWMLWRLRPRGLGPLAAHALVDRIALTRLIALNRDIFLRTLCLLGAFGWFAHLGAQQGDATLAANALLLNFQTFMAYGLDGFAHAAEALVGAAAGARDRATFRQAVRVTLLWSALGALLFALVYWAAGGWIVARLTDQADIRAVALRYLPWAAVSPIVSVWGFLLDGVFIGATQTQSLMRAMVASLAVFIAATPVAVGPFGNHGLWFALLLFMAARCATLARHLPALVRRIGPDGPAAGA